MKIIPDIDFSRQELQSRYFKYNETTKEKYSLNELTNREPQQGNVKYKK